MLVTVGAPLSPFPLLPDVSHSTGAGAGPHRVPEAATESVLTLLPIYWVALI